MLKHYLTSAVRSLSRHRMYTSLSVLALAIGLAMSVLVAGHVVYEFSFENMHENGDRIYRVETTRVEYVTFDEDGNETRQIFGTGRVPSPMASAVIDEIPEVEMAAVFREWNDLTVRIDQETLDAGNMFLATPEFLQVFTLPLKRGNPRTALSQPFEMLVTEEAALKYFGVDDPVGREVNVNGLFDGRIVGVLEDIPHNTDVHCEFIASYATLASIGTEFTAWEVIPEDYVYMLLHESADPEAVERKVIDIAASYRNEDSPSTYEFGIRQLDDIHFGSVQDGVISGPGPFGEWSMVLVMMFVGAFILFQAIANFANLSLARGAERIREVGVRKVFGADRSQLVRQFLGESVIISFIAMLLGIMVYELVRPGFNSLLERDALATIYDTPMMALSLIGLVLVTGVLSGSYPALFISRFRPIAVLQRRISFKSSKSIMRKLLVTFQFVVAIFFIICTTIVYRQTQYVTSMDLGFETENIVVLDLEGDDAAARCQLLKHEIVNNCDVVAVAATNCPPGRLTYRARGYSPQNDYDREPLLARFYYADYDFVSMFGLNLTRGQTFTDDLSSDIAYPMIVNESAVTSLEMDNPIGYSLPYGPGHAEVVGVVEDFHGSSFGYSYRKLSVVVLNPDECDVLAVKIHQDRTTETLASIREVWSSTFPDEPFVYSFLTDEVEANYADMYAQGFGMLVLASMTTLIACMGILGLVSYSAAQRTKEVGIRRVLGASVSGILRLLTKEFILLVGIANVIAWPLAYFFIRDFLREFTYQVGIGPGTFLLTGAVAMTVAIASSAVQALRVARANPVEALRHE